MRARFIVVMRLALVVGSTYEENGKLAPVSTIELDRDRIAARLAASDAGFAIHRLSADRALPDVIESLLGGFPGRPAQVLLYFSGYAVLSQERGPALLLDGPRLGTLSLRRLRRVLEQYAKSSCVVVDAAAVVDAGQSPRDVVSAMGNALTAGAPTIAMLAAARDGGGDARPREAAASLGAIDESGGGSHFTNLLLRSLEWLVQGREPHQPVDLAWLFEAMRADEATWGALASADLFGAATGFVLLPPSRAANGIRAANPPREAPSVSSNGLGARTRTTPVDPAGAIEQALAAHPEDAELRDRAIDAYAAQGDLERALQHCRRAIRVGPGHVGAYRRARALLEAAGREDAAWNAACALLFLGAADHGESQFAHRHRPDGLLPVRGTLPDEAWGEGLRPVEYDRTAEQVLEALGIAAVRVGVAFAKQKKRYVEPDPGTLQDLNTSTTMLAKTLVWTARVLGVVPPALYVLPDLGAELDVAQNENPSAFAGRSLGSGLGLPELAFLWGRCLSRFRPELRALSFFRTPDELGSLLSAAALLGGAPGITERSLDPDGRRLYAALRRDLRGINLSRLEAALASLSIAEIGGHAHNALAASELIGMRAGLLASGDAASAAQLLRRFPGSGLVSEADQLGDLFSFAVSDAYAALRRRLGVGIDATSLRPPSPFMTQASSPPGR